MSGSVLLSVFRNYAVTLVVFLAADMVWLLFIGKNLYQKHLGYLMAEKVQLVPALIFYLIFTAAVVFFVVQPGLEKESLTYVITSGLFFGLASYAAYDLTNLSTVKDWPVLITIVDLIWGSFVSAFTGVVSYLILKNFQ